MEASEEFDVEDHLTSPAGTSFSQLLFGDDDDDANAVGLPVDHTHAALCYSPVFSIQKNPKMLCFGNSENEGRGDLLLAGTNKTPQKSVVTSSDSSSASSCNHSSSSFNSLSKSNSLQKKRNGSGQEPARCTDAVIRAGVGTQRPPKKTKAENPTSTGHAKRKEKLGERIAALQQLVSPFGKTDTASVLHEAMGYIRFLHDQVQVLCSPYLQRLPSSPHHHLHHLPGDRDNKGEEEDEEEGEEEAEEVKRDLRSMGLCLIPVGCTVHVATSNGADFWSPATGNNNNNNVSPSAKQQ